MPKIKRYLCLIFSCVSLLIAADKDEYRRIADSSFAAVLRECGAKEEHERWCLTLSPLCIRKILWMDKSFGRVTSGSVGDDLSYARFQERGRTILEQLQLLDSSRIGAIFGEDVGKRGIGTFSKLPSAEISDANVIVNYLVHHLIALRHASEAGIQGGNGAASLERALIFEAISQSYLIDAFSAGHILVPLSDKISFLHPRNNKEAHNFYNGQGVYVLNSRGEAWQTFGDRLLEWYAPTFRHIFEACCTSLRELFLAYYVSAQAAILPQKLELWAKSVAGEKPISIMVNEWLTAHNGQRYYSDFKMPSLLLPPMPVSATWSLRMRDADEHGIHHRKHYPQIRATSEDPGFHDPSLDGIDDEFLYQMESLPEWMQPQAWLPPDSLRGKKFTELLPHRRKSLAGNLIKRDKNVASVRYMQERYYAPMYWGLLFHAGGGYLLDSGTSSGIWSAGVGYAPALALLPDVPLLDRLSLDLTYTQFTENNPRRLLSISGGLSLGLYPYRVGTKKHFRYLEYLRLEGGYVWGLRSLLKSHGALLALGLESGIIPLGFTYAGISLRLKYQLMLLRNTLHGVSLDFILQ